MADETKVYVLDDAANVWQGMTKEQIISAITQAVNEGTISNIDSGFVSKIREMNKSGNVKIWIGTMAEFNAIDTKDQDTLYLFTDDPTIEDIEDRMDSIEETLLANIEATTGYFHKVKITAGEGIFNIYFDVFCRTANKLTSLAAIASAVGMNSFESSASGYTKVLSVNNPIVAVKIDLGAANALSIKYTTSSTEDGGVADWFPVESEPTIDDTVFGKLN